MVVGRVAPCDCDLIPPMGRAPEGAHPLTSLNLMNSKEAPCGWYQVPRQQHVVSLDHTEVVFSLVDD